MVRTSKNIVWEEVAEGEHTRVCLSVCLSVQVSCLTLLLPGGKLVKNGSVSRMALNMKLRVERNTVWVSFLLVGKSRPPHEGRGGLEHIKEETKNRPAKCRLSASLSVAWLLSYHMSFHRLFWADYFTLFEGAVTCLRLLFFISFWDWVCNASTQLCGNLKSWGHFVQNKLK